MRDPGYELRRILLLGTSVNKKLLVRQLALRGLVGAQPQRDVGWLHSLPYHPHQVVAQGIQVRLVPELDREGFQGLSGVVLPSVEAPVYERLDTASQGVEQSGYQQGGDDYGQLGLLLLSREGAEEGLGRRHAPEVHERQHRGERPVDEGAVYDHVDVEEAVLHDRYAREDRQPEQGDVHDHDADVHAPDSNNTAYQDGADHHRAPVGEPLDLLALLALGAPEPAYERDG